jgi:hypothetical protein
MFNEELYEGKMYMQRSDIISILINNGADVDKRNNYGLSPITYGTSSNNLLSLLIF